MAKQKSYNENLGDFFKGFITALFAGHQAAASMGDKPLPTATQLKKEGITSPLPNPQDAIQQKPDKSYEKLKTYFADQLGSLNPARKNPESYFPILKEYPYLKKKEKQYNRPGLANMLALQSLFESTGGRAGNNAFGVKPPGGKSFANLKDAIDYQTSSRVLGGGHGNKLDILDKKGQIQPDEIKKIYDSYNPNSPYVDKLISAYKDIEGN